MRSKVGSKLYSFIQNCSTVKSTEDFKELIRVDLCKLLPHDMAAYGIVTVRDGGKSRFVNLGFPADYAERIASADFMRSAVVRNWIERRVPEFHTTNDLESSVPGEWVRAARDNGVYNLAWHGVLDLMSPLTTFFKFGCLHIRRAEEVTRCLYVVTPHLHAALSTIFANDIVKREIGRDVRESHDGAAEPAISRMHGTGRLSVRETEVLMWLYYGKTNSEIADILNTSVFTAKNHVQNILTKLGASNRTQAVSQALRTGLLSGKLLSVGRAPAAEPLRKRE